MDVKEGKGKKGNLIVETWERCKSLGRGSKRTLRLTRKSKSWPRIEASLEDDRKSKRNRQVAPEGCFSVYVGPQKQRFVIKTEYANHPLFKVLLEEAESEYGYNPEGPLALPCNVDIFCRVLVAMDDDGDETHRGCGFPKNRGSYQLLSPLI
ncbi:hypothetical protein K2173_006925 [Erythroxylum novogranatense]|uniref:Small auxin up regulated protein n=1 Tax=Erythroxylum novogranatense TaxID=1862640 RepID=A0AAV8SZH4_9ROSI|nr:hypothetical protein K2173_006692 [Erythroxylum novogranatense]KAJ8759405.1 hypothetical protein K2173_006925 [Erythroxylum novogranatense]